MNELYKLERITLECYETFNFLRGTPNMQIYHTLLTLLSSHGCFDEFRQRYAFLAIL